MHHSVVSTVLITLFLSFAHSTPVAREPPTRVVERDEPMFATSVAAQATVWPEGSCHMKFLQSRTTTDPYRVWVEHADVRKPSSERVGDGSASQLSPADGTVGTNRDNAVKITANGLDHEVWMWQNNNAEGKAADAHDSEMTVAYDQMWWNTTPKEGASSDHTNEVGTVVTTFDAKMLPVAVLEDWYEGRGQGEQDRWVEVGWMC